MFLVAHLLMSPTVMTRLLSDTRAVGVSENCTLIFIVIYYGQSQVSWWLLVVQQIPRPKKRVTLRIDGRCTGHVHIAWKINQHSAAICQVE